MFRLTGPRMPKCRVKLPSSRRGHYPPDSILQVVHLVALPGRSDRKSLKLLDLEFANSIALAPGRRKLTIFDRSRTTRRPASTRYAPFPESRLTLQISQRKPFRFQQGG